MDREDSLKDLKREWEQRVIDTMRGGGQGPADGFRTESGIEVKPLYTPLDLEEIGFDCAKDLGFPGKFPFTRGKDPLGYRQKPWLMLQYSGYGDPEETNKRYRFLLEQGGTGISVALDLPTQLGHDSDDPLAEGEVGKVGVPIDSLQDMETLFDGIPLNKPRQISTTANAIGPIWLAMLIVLAEKQGAPVQECSFRIQNDVLKEFIARGLYIYPPEPSLNLSTDLIAYCVDNYPHWAPLTVCGYHIREAGASAPQEIAFAIANLVAYVDAVREKNVSLETFLPGLASLFSCGIDFFEEIAKFRALRRLWARTLYERYEVSDPDLLSFNILSFTAGSTLTAQQPMNNLVRVAVEVLASALAGCQYIHASSMDEALCTPTEQSLKMSLRTQQIIANETGVERTVDPLGGSYFIERLTTEIEERAKKHLELILDMGGSIEAIRSGYYHRELSRSAFELNRRIEEGEHAVVGVNRYVEEDEPYCELLRVDPGLEMKHKEKLKKLRSARNSTAVQEALGCVKESAENRENVIPTLIEAVRAYATVGEMCDALRDVYGEYSGPGHF